MSFEGVLLTLRVFVQRVWDVELGRQVVEMGLRNSSLVSSYPSPLGGKHFRNHENTFP